MKLNSCFFFWTWNCKVKCNAFFIHTNKVNCLVHVWNESKTFDWNIMNPHHFKEKKEWTLKRNCLHWLFFSNRYVWGFSYNMYPVDIMNNRSFLPLKCYIIIEKLLALEILALYKTKQVQQDSLENRFSAMITRTNCGLGSYYGLSEHAHKNL